MNGDTAVRLSRAAPPRPASFFEFWPDWAFYTPVVLHWLALAIRHRSLTLPSAANPNITSGGLVGESKSAILDQVAGPARALIAPYVTLRTGPGGDLPAAEAALARAGLAYPVVAKPDIACNGAGVRVIAGRDALGAYLAAFPRGEALILQELVTLPGEAGVFYVREPGVAVGRITSVTLKHVPFVVGDGRSTLRDLVLADARAGSLAWMYLPHLAGRAAEVPAPGARVPLVFVGNHCKGSIFENGIRFATPALADAVERLARAMPEFHFGRIDLRFATLADLAGAQGLRVIEINGAGSEATHVWDPTTRLADAWQAQFQHYGAAFRIGAANRARGFRPVGPAELIRLWRLHRRLMRSYPAHD
ncbi:MAG: D-alanine--D-alanine ligase [Rhodospirillales bacterium]|nr:D-alanine--D-alanine ligase [Rhodospirillales bacterium]